jgi:hypothetical protein
VTRNLDGKVELTWTNKAQRLISHEDPSTKPPYAWVRTSDFRVAETRLLEEVAHVGEAAAECLLIRGDALYALTALGSNLAGGPNLTGKVKLAYPRSPSGDRVNPRRRSPGCRPARRPPKADDAAKDADVLAKADAAKRWAAHVTANTGIAWHYLFAREKDIETTKGSWEALKKLAGA